MEISLEASWVGVQRHGQDLAVRLAQGFSGLLHVQPPQLLPWSPPPLMPPKLVIPFDIDLPVVPFVGGVRSRGGVADLPAVAVSSLVEIGGRIGQAGCELGGYVGGAAQGFSGLLHAQTPHLLPPKLVIPFDIDLPVVPFVGGVRSRGGVADLPAVAVSSLVEIGGRLGQAGSELGDYVGGAVQQIARRVPVPFRAERPRRRKWEAVQPPPPADEGEAALAVEAVGHKRIALERVGDRESLEVAAAAAAAATGSAAAASASGIGAGDADEEDEEGDGLECEIGTLDNVKKDKSFMDVQFPNGQVTYVAGEGITATGFFPLFGGLLQAHGKCPGETRVSFSFKSKHGTRFTPMFQWPDNSLSFGVEQAVAWKRSGLMVRPSVQVSVCPTFGGSDPGLRAEFVHSLKDELNVMCGFSCSRHPSAFTALSLGRSKWNGQGWVKYDATGVPNSANERTVTQVQA
ncbi:hypothetical protein PR202_gb01916 [Eleusine coracana subsp. coracana]|uniref:Uncharacterized protein n=1 Tax=Eleusine coracana subsp. coracana TaxID=191504 RepID=A0AAV5DXH0_ELECO|nr:hypothetical protein PR202_gb01916 [Eleusine coracana subsp. coracana]